jgi:TM2 domain-containing membrane protein YozV
MDSASAMTSAAATGSAAGSGISEKGFVPMILLCFFLGGLGVHRFYAGKVGTGLLMLVTFGGFGIWTIVDFIMIVTGNFKDGDGVPIKSS